MTSDAIEESGVNVFMLALAVGMGRHVDAWNQLQQTQTNRATCGNSIRAGERQAHVFNIILSLFLSAAAHAMRAPVRRSAFWLGVCGVHHAWGIGAGAG